MEIANLIAQMKQLIKRMYGQKRFLNISQDVEERNVKHVRNIKRWKVNSFNTYLGASLVVQWLRLCSANAEGPSSNPGWGARSHMVQQRWEILWATTKTWLDLRIPKIIYFCFIDYVKAFDCVTTSWKILKEMGIPDHLTCLLRNLYAGQEETKPDMEQRTDSKLGKEYVEPVHCHPVYLTYMQSTWFEMPGWMIHKLKWRLPGEISMTSDMQMTPLKWQKAKRN